MLTVTQSPSVVLLPNQAVAPQLPSKKDIRLEAGDFVARLALTEEESMAAYRLRFLVFNLEMNEGLESAYVDGYDKDHFDDVCDHMIVEDRGRVRSWERIGCRWARSQGSTLGITASRSSALRRMSRCGARLWNWGERAFIASIGRRMCCICCGAVLRDTRW